MLTIKILLQMTLIVSFGYLTLGFFQRLFCKDLSSYSYSRFCKEKSRIWTRFKIAIKLKNYQVIIGLFILCFLGFFNSIYELSEDWQLGDKKVSWQIWGLIFSYAIYSSHTNMKLKIFYDLTGRDPRESLKKQDTGVVLSTITKELDKILAQKKLVRILIGTAIVGALVALWGGYSGYRSDEEVKKALIENRNYKAEKNIVIHDLDEYKKTAELKEKELTEKIKTLTQSKTIIKTSREKILNTPIDFKNQREREEIYKQMVKETQ